MWFIQLVKDLEDTRDQYHGYAYVRTLRNIIVGKKDAAIAPLFQGKPYYGCVPYLTLQETEKIFDALVQINQLELILTEHGKLYCTPEYHEYLCQKM